MHSIFSTKILATIGVTAAVALAGWVFVLSSTAHTTPKGAVSNSAVSVDINLGDSTSGVAITQGGEHTLSGTLTNGQILVDAGDEDITLVLNGVDITNSAGAAIYIKSAGDVTIALAPKSINLLTQLGTDKDEEEAGAIYSTSDVVLSGAKEAELIVSGDVLDGIVGKDDLVISNITLSVSAADDGIRGKDSVAISASDINVEAGGDGITATNNEDTEKGWVSVAGSTLTLSAAGDGIFAARDITVESGSIAITTGGGSENAYDSDTSTKGIKSNGTLTLLGGTLTIDSADDSLHAATTIAIKGGDITLSSGDDGIHADSTINISGSTLTINKAYEGVEAQYINVSGGTIAMTTRDDGFNISGGSDASATVATSGRGGAGFGGGMNAVIDGALTISGGNISVNAQGDGLDSNGNMVITGGVIFVDGPTNNGNGALDVNGTFTISGGALLAIGSSGMAEAPNGSSSQYSMLVNLDSAQSAGTVVKIVSVATGETLIEYASKKIFQSVVYSSPQLVNGANYELYLNGALYTTLTLSGITTTEGQSSMMGGPGGGMGGMRDTMQSGTGTMPEGMTPPDFQEGMTPPEPPTW